MTKTLAPRDVWEELAGGSAGVRTTVNLPVDAVNALKEIAEGRGTSIAAVIRRAIWIEKYLHDVSRKGGAILIESRNGSITELLID